MLALALFLLPQSLQTEPLQRSAGPPTRVHYDAASGVFRVLPRPKGVRPDGRPSASPTDASTPPARAAAAGAQLVSTFENTLTQGFFSVPTTGTEWIDWGTKRAGSSQLVGRFQIGYGTSARGPSEGGPGAALGVGFYSGTTGFCSRGQALPYDPDAELPEGVMTLMPGEARFLFRGLPGATGSQVRPSFLVTVDLPMNAPLVFPDGPIGWSYIGIDNMGQGADTGPVLTAYGSNTSVQDAFDVWSRPDELASCVTTGFFGGCEPPFVGQVPPCGSFYMKLYEWTGLPAPVTTGVSHPSNRDGFGELSPAALGSEWTTEVDTGSDPNPMATFVLLSTGSVPGGMSMGRPGSGRLLIERPFSRIQRRSALGADVTEHAFRLPADLNMIGIEFHAQAIVETRRGHQRRFEALNALRVKVGLGGS